MYSSRIVIELLYVSKWDIVSERCNRVPAIEEVVFWKANGNLVASIRAILCVLSVDCSAIWRTLKEDEIQSYQLQIVQALKPDNCSLLVFFTCYYAQQALEIPPSCG
ncbi:hypothetical protein TNIN_159171 [Trichonephila inaurata madagascariensis]|uniref:Uncharacterized protein n=1 Tax=Trichonephila inaurata madagascariensis TaxID=2747483 RepID=A0A8X6YWM2_9ARAC|nr:hypothetical protein TNIN_159171 [Trichonephila inaurata madagascariensis]